MSDALAQARPEAGLVPDAWLTEQLSRPVFRWELGADVPDLDAVPGAFVYTRVPEQCRAQLPALRDAGFRLIDLSVTLERTRLDAAPPTPGVLVRDATTDDREAVTRLASLAFSWSRFHLDPRIGRDAADSIKAEWAANYFAGGRGDAMVVATDGNDVVGFLLAIEAADGACVIDLVAVDERCRGRGVAAALTRAAQDRMPEATRLRVGTQLANEPALRAYRRLGFEPVAMCDVLHFHGDPGNECHANR